ncbi:hypothetical protein TSUD_35160 [Trifolium subterraneum]|uniref:Hexosyltransferase n=1 Tax=Trifolium subterraneum TaxID=3900 RepID=A0A2Z6LWA0_TRISU|nr:hypothetical protein TSUD_35160 [Trifolium subterraneum]
MAPDLITAATNITNAQGKATKRAFVTFLAGNGDYVKGVVGLAKGLRKVKTMYPLVVAVLPDVPVEHRNILISQGCIVKEIEPVYPPENQTQFAMAYYVINYSKLRIWALEDYDKMIYLDGDIQVFQNIDHLFDLPNNYFYAVKDCFCEASWRHTKQYEIGYCQQCPDKGSKPWRYTGEEENMQREDIKMLVNKWWDVYEDESLDYKEPINANKLTSAILDASGIKFVPAPSAA